MTPKNDMRVVGFWDPDGVGGKPNNLLVGGYQWIGRWDGLAWTQLGTPNAYISGFATNGEFLSYSAWQIGLGNYLNGFFGSSNNFGAATGSYVVGMGPCACVVYYHNQVLIGTSASGTDKGSIWSGTFAGWVKGLGGDTVQMVGDFDSLVVIGDSLIAGGWFNITTPDGVIMNLAIWNGTNWQPFASGAGKPRQIFAAVEYQGKLVVAGIFDDIDGATYQGVLRWSGSVWEKLNPTPPWAWATRLLAVEGDNLFTAGPASDVISKWDGASWTTFAEPMNGQVSSIAAGNGELIVCFYASWPGSVVWRRAISGIPWIAQSPVDRVAIGGTNTTFAAAVAKGYDGLAYQWRRNGIAIRDGAGGAAPGGGTVVGAIGTVNGGVLVEMVIQGTTGVDVGAYDVVFSSPCGTVTSGAALLNVQGVNASDFDKDGDVDDGDFVLFVQQYNVMLCSSGLMPDRCSADLTKDRVVDDRDFVAFLAAYLAFN
ncbi:MAG: hypothetical protein KF805_13220 [Phycisphaeraceae bacterium]|nr:hypothetical protein [Phycisphaeraceae bacterium]